jgi:hypothetical protein
MSAFGGKADMTVRVCLLSWSLLGVKRTSLFAAHYVRWCDPAKNLFAGAKRSGSQNNGGKKQVEVASCV